MAILLQTIFGMGSPMGQKVKYSSQPEFTPNAGEGIVLLSPL